MMRRHGWSWPELAATPWRVIQALTAIDEATERRRRKEAGDG